jgi:hypothetical protein
MGLLDRFFKRKPTDNASPMTGEEPVQSSEVGFRTTPENRILYLYRTMWTDPVHHQRILDLRYMDSVDGRIKKIHTRMARTVVKGGLKIETDPRNKSLISAWANFEKRLGLTRIQKLESDARGLVMEGNLPIQWVLNGDRKISRGVRMASETIQPIVEPNGQFKSPEAAYRQIDLSSGREEALFPLWQLTMVRLTPDNYDDMGAMGRPYLDANRTVWQKLIMTEEDLVIRRRQRAPLRMAHTLEGATKDELEDYRHSVEQDQQDITTDYYLNKKGGVAAVQGDANLDQIADVSYLLDTFFAGAPAPKGLFGYVGDLNRDILEDLKRDYYEEIDALQDAQAECYEEGFRLSLLLSGINPDAYDFSIIFAERRTDTPNQRADLALKYQALGVPADMVWSSSGLDPAKVLAGRAAQANSNDPYPKAGATAPTAPSVSVTPGNAPKGESATSIGNP